VGGARLSWQAMSLVDGEWTHPSQLSGLSADPSFVPGPGPGPCIIRVTRIGQERAIKDLISSLLFRLDSS
jgi:hypothetical protein